MQLTVPPDLEVLIRKRLSTGGYADAEDVVRRALEAQDAQQDAADAAADDAPHAIRAHIEKGYLEAERGELLDAARVQVEIAAQKQAWRASRR